MGLEIAVIRCVGASDAHIQNLIARASQIDGGQCKYARSRKYDEDVVQIQYDENIPKRILDDVMRVFADGLEECLYALDDTPLDKQLVELLKLRGKTLSVAESFTGGGISRRIVSVSGASKVFFEGLNTYNELSKIKRLGVSEYTLKTFGAVSDQTAYEMAAGLMATGDCDISIATTGLAGPTSDNSALPVGLCYIAVGTKEKVFVYRYKFNGTREEITETAINYALFLAYKQLKKM
jgi:PncC family amidohydrolase